MFFEIIWGFGDRGLGGGWEGIPILDPRYSVCDQWLKGGDFLYLNILWKSWRNLENLASVDGF